MFREIAHFVWSSRELIPLRRRHSRAEFAERLATKVDEQGFAEIRRELVGDLDGDVLEIGCGTGAMFPHYGERARVEAIEPEEDFLALAVARANAHGGAVQAGRGDGTRLAFPDASFDAVVLSLVLCSVPSPARVLEESLRVLRPGGVLRALEHVRSEAPLSGFLMDVANPLWLRLNRQGCSWNRDPLAEIRAAGFEIDEVVPFQRFDTLLPAFPMRRIRARRRRQA
ncbi:MAG: class I SAM-dependent methyltransferase [Myxococcales bacterium]|nr:class I SAM-dependent methyltransferase [Myxococcales bacterium]